MHEVIPKFLWVGNAGDLYKPAAIELAGIKAIIQVALAEQMPQLSRELLLAHFPIMDGSGNTRGIVGAAIDLTASLIRDRVPTLVCCSGGMSRSPCITAGALAIVRRAEPDATLQEIIAGHPHDVAPGLWEEVRAHVRRHYNQS
jgi:hypothetical protein